jgi:hypothetical protein
MIGVIPTIVVLRALSCGTTAVRGIAPGSSTTGSRREATGPDRDDVCCSARRRGIGALPPNAEAYLERQRECSNRTLPYAADREASDF